MQLFFRSFFTLFQLLTEVTSKTVDDMWAVMVKTLINVADTDKQN